MAIRKYKDEKTSHKAKLRYINNRNREQMTCFSFRFNKESEKDIIEFLKSTPDKIGLIRRLIREEIKKGE